MEEDRPHDWRYSVSRAVCRQKPENLENLPERYYKRLAENPNRDWVRRYVKCEYGEDPSGVAVFRDCFRRAFHTVDHLEPVMGKTMIIGQDFGSSPCSVICQPDHRGRLLVLEEVLAEDIGLETHVSRSLKPAYSPTVMPAPVRRRRRPQRRGEGEFSGGGSASMSFDDLVFRRFLLQRTPSRVDWRRWKTFSSNRATAGLQLSLIEHEMPDAGSCPQWRLSVRAQSGRAHQAFTGKASSCLRSCRRPAVRLRSF